MWRKEIFLLLIFICFLFISRAQDNFDPKISLRNTSISQWTSEDGLVSNSLTNVCQSSDGLIWITSYNGFMIYDGETIEIYDKNKFDFLDTNGFYDVEEGEDGKIYLASQGSGIIVYDNKSFYKLDSLGKILPKGISAVYHSANDSIMYFGSIGKGLYKLEKETISHVMIPQFEESFVRSIIHDKNGVLWVASEGDGLVGVKEGIIRHYNTSNGLLDNSISSLAINKQGELLIGTSKGLQVFNQKNELSTINEFKNISINNLFVDKWNSVWVGAELGVYRWNKAINKIDSIKSKRNVDLVRINSITGDREGNLWMTSSRLGLLQLKESNIYNWSEPFIDSDRVYKVHESWTGDFYICSDQNSISVVSGQECKTIEIKTNLKGYGVRDIYHDEDGSLWLATYEGIIHIDNGEETVYSTESGLLSNNFRVIYKDKSGNYWFGSRSGGIVKIHDGEVVASYSKKNVLASNFVFSINEDSNGDILVGTHSGGLSIIRKNGEVDTFHLKNDDAVILLFNIDLFPDNTAIVVSNIGLLYFDGSSLRSVPLQENLRSKTYFDGVIGQMNHIWITTNIGVLKINRDDWQSYIDQEITELSYVLFDENNGMNNKECTGATSSMLSASGDIYIPTLGGVCIFDPRSIKENDVEPVIVIRKVLVDQKDYLKADVKEVPSGSLRFVFQFSALSFHAPNKNQYKYKLEGLDDDWSEIVYDGKVEYTNLESGIYTFKVIGSNDNDVWNDTGDSFKFTVKSRFYETFWFFVLWLSLIITVLIFIYKWRTSFINRQNKELKKVNNELDRFVYSTSHEMRSPLSSILGLVNIARSDQENIVEYLDHIENSVLRLDSFIHDIIDFSKNARLGLQLEDIYLETLMHELFQSVENIECLNIIEFKVIYHGEFVLHSDYERVKVICANLLNNAFKHHDPKNIKNPYVHVNISNIVGGVRIEFKDNGPGIEEQHKKKIFKMFYRANSRSDGSGLGLYMVEEIVSKLNGRLEMTSKVKEGASFVLYLPNL